MKNPLHFFNPSTTAKQILAGESPYEGLADCLAAFCPHLAKQRALAEWLNSEATSYLPPSIKERAKDWESLRQSMTRKPLVSGCIRALLRFSTGKTLYIRKSANNLLPGKGNK